MVAPRVEGDQVGAPARPSEGGGRRQLGGRSGLDEVDGGERGVVRRGQAAVRLHDHQAIDAPGLERAIELRDVAADGGPEIGVDDGGAAALVLPELGADVARAGDEDAGQRRTQDVRERRLVRRVGVGMQEADRHRADARGAELVHDIVGVERLQHRTIGIHPFPHTVTVAPFDQRLRPFDAQAVKVRALLPAQFDDVGEAAGGEQRGAGALALDQRVGPERRAVADDRSPDVVGAGDSVDRLDHRALRVVGIGGHLEGLQQRPCAAIEDDGVGEGAADVDADQKVADRHGAEYIRLKGRHRSPAAPRAAGPCAS